MTDHPTHRLTTAEKDIRREALERAGLRLGKARARLVLAQGEFDRAKSEAQSASDDFDAAEAAFSAAVEHKRPEGPVKATGETAGERGSEGTELGGPEKIPHPAATVGPGNSVTFSTQVNPAPSASTADADANLSF